MFLFRYNLFPIISSRFRLTVVTLIINIIEVFNKQKTRNKNEKKQQKKQINMRKKMKDEKINKSKNTSTFERIRLLEENCLFLARISSCQLVFFCFLVFKRELRFQLWYFHLDIFSFQFRIDFERKRNSRHVW